MKAIHNDSNIPPLNYCRKTLSTIILFKRTELLGLEFIIAFMFVGLDCWKCPKAGRKTVDVSFTFGKGRERWNTITDEVIGLS